jgi:hypothetical protein
VAGDKREALADAMRRLLRANLDRQNIQRFPADLARYSMDQILERGELLADAEDEQEAAIAGVLAAWADFDEEGRNEDEQA